MSHPPAPPTSPDPRVATVLHSIGGVLEAAPSAVVVVDAADVVVYLNPAVEATLGLTPAEHLGQPVGRLFDVHLPELLHEARDAFTTSDAGSGRERLRGSALARHRDGTEVALEVRLTPIPVDDEVWVLIGTTDVTARRQEEQRVQRLTQSYLTLAQINQAIVRAPDVAALFADTCRVAVEHGYLAAWVGQPAPGTDRVEAVTTAGRLDDYIRQLRISLDPADLQGNGPTAIALREARPYYSDAFMSDATTGPWHALATGYGIAASATLPLRRGGSTVAVLTLYSDQPGVFDRPMRDLLSQVADNVSYALGAFAAADRLRLVAAQRSELLRRLVTAQETERARIAADVHDESVQALAAADLRLGLLQRRVREAAPDLEPSVTQVQQIIAAATAGLRELLFELEPPAAAPDLAAAVREVATHLLEDQPLTWSLECDAGVALPGVEQVQALRILKEALLNVRRHAEARSVAITVRSRHDGVEVAVTDDGRGLDPEALPRVPGHRGLETMRDRAELSGGWWRVERAEAGGTTLRFWVPRGGRDADHPPA